MYTGIIVDLGPLIRDLAKYEHMWDIYARIPLKRIISIVLSVHESEYGACIIRDAGDHTHAQDLMRIEIFYLALSQQIHEYVYRIGMDVYAMEIDSWVDSTSVVLRVE